MAILSIVSNNSETFAPGSYCPIDYYNAAANREATGVIVVEVSHVGYVVNGREANYYDDSDFYLTVWDPVAKTAREICYATTRGWCGPCFASCIDASPEVMAEYRAWGAAQYRRHRIVDKRDRRNQELAKATKLGLTRKQYARLSAVDNGGLLENLLKTKTFRSAFRKSLNDQVRNWLTDPAPKYKQPLSYKQMDSLARW
jgi:hypothetical protein